MKTNSEKVKELILTDVSSDVVVNEDTISEKTDFFSKMYPLSEEEKAEVLRELHSRLSIRMDKGACVIDKDHKPWYNSAKKDLDTKFWDRYVLYIRKSMGFGPKVVDALDRATDEMMDMLGNPKVEGGFSRRGLVVGDVQSGKTATYTALINKAADSGYRVVILLTGTIEKLRRQTQLRLDEGFIGLDSTAFTKDKNSVLIGVGEIDPSFSGWAVTSTSADFNIGTARRLTRSLVGVSEPVLFVVKKNKSVLEKLESWLRLFNAHQSTKMISLPLLLIDDEADNASVNTRAEEDPTAINVCIRKLLSLFEKSNYVGFTATPFANIFINPDTNDEMLQDDLFPRNFIYALEPPSNYIGALGVFSDGGPYEYMLKANDDCEQYLPFGHKMYLEIESMPDSMRAAIASFFIANTIRDLRRHNKSHRSMLINVSYLVKIQEKLGELVDSFVRDYQREIRNYYKMGAKALEYESFKYLKKIYEEHFLDKDSIKYPWETIQEALHAGVSSIVVKTINGSNASKNLNYDEHEEDGLRIIAIGGFSLSRGLTLEGLCVSYIYRNSKMYDTLMQMGRWFGYRDKYEDLCQIWLSEDAVEYYRYISMASDDLRSEIRRMQDAGLTPTDFGLAVRSDINSLLVTARNKMRTARDYAMTVSLNGKVVETPYIHSDKKILEDNLQLTEIWLMSLFEKGYELNLREELALKHLQILSVPKELILDYVSAYNSHPLNMEFRTEDLTSLIASYDDDSLDYWDVVVGQGEGRDIKLAGKELSCISRRFIIKSESKAIQLSGARSRLGSISYGRGGLTTEKSKEIEDQFKRLHIDDNKSMSESAYFSSGIKRNPLLCVYPVELNAKSKNLDNKDYTDSDKEILINSLGTPMIGLSIGIPRIDGRLPKTYQFKINLVKYKELLGFDDIDEEEENQED